MFPVFIFFARSWSVHTSMYNSMYCCSQDLQYHKLPEFGYIESVVRIFDYIHVIVDIYIIISTREQTVQGYLELKCPKVSS